MCTIVESVTAEDEMLCPLDATTKLALVLHNGTFSILFYFEYHSRNGLAEKLRKVNIDFTVPIVVFISN